MYLFNTYHRQVPEVVQYMYHEQPSLNRLVGPVINCDWVEFLVEYGVIGVGLLCLAVALAVGAAFWWRKGAPGETLFLLYGAAGISIHAYFDYVLRNPAIMLLSLGTLVVLVRLSVPSRQPARSAERLKRSSSDAT